MSLFHFKEFVVDQKNCPMKINTDGVLLGALADVKDARRVCDIGTGTGVIALMLAQRNHDCKIDAIDIDFNAVDTASYNFNNSLFHEQLKCHHHHFVEFFEMRPGEKYDLIVANPPFFLNSLHSPSQSKTLARHTNKDFFVDLLRLAALHLSENGILQLVVPLDISILLKNLATDYHLFNTECIEMKSFYGKNTFRHILKFEKDGLKPFKTTDFIIYKKEGEHSLQYIETLKNFFTIF